jgi:HAD superfamily hydrolase (TIGR01484 family)
MQPLSNMSVESAHRIKALLFDLDGTFVSKDTLLSSTYSSLEKIRNSGIKTIAVTGRPAGWCDLMARWWPIDAVVGENGAFSYSKVNDRIVRNTYHDSVLYPAYQQKLQALFEELLAKYNYLKLASDQSFRHWDIAIDIAEESEVPLEAALDIVRICQEKGARAAISNIHVNIWFGDYNKENMSIKVLNDFGLTKNDGIYIGDSPNDSPMFGYFPLSIGVSSVLNYKEIMDNLPNYVTKGSGAEGFVELMEFISLTR